MRQRPPARRHGAPGSSRGADHREGDRQRRPIATASGPSHDRSHSLVGARTDGLPLLQSGGRVAMSLVVDLEGWPARHGDHCGHQREGPGRGEQPPRTARSRRAPAGLQRTQASVSGGTAGRHRPILSAPQMQRCKLGSEPDQRPACDQDHFFGPRRALQSACRQDDVDRMRTRKWILTCTLALLFTGLTGGAAHARPVLDPVARAASVCADYPNQAAAQRAARHARRRPRRHLLRDLPCPCLKPGAGPLRRLRAGRRPRTTRPAARSPRACSRSRSRSPSTRTSGATPSARSARAGRRCWCSTAPAPTRAATACSQLADAHRL